MNVSTDAHKQKHVPLAQIFLHPFAKESVGMFKHIVTENKSWILFKHDESKQSNIDTSLKAKQFKQVRFA